MSRATGIKAQLLEGENLFERVQTIPGAFYYVEWEGVPDAGFRFSCPCGCGSIGMVLVKGTKSHPTTWANAGSREVPTIRPSIGFGGAYNAPKEDDGYHWHGYLRDGIWESC